MTVRQRTQIDHPWSIFFVTCYTEAIRMKTHSIAARFLTGAILAGALSLGSLSAIGASQAISTASAKTVASTVAVTNPPVKKSVNNLCHAKGTRYYNQTKKFTAYKTMKDCQKSGGKLPKK